MRRVTGKKGAESSPPGGMKEFTRNQKIRLSRGRTLCENFRGPWCNRIQEALCLEEPLHSSFALKNHKPFPLCEILCRRHLESFPWQHSLYQRLTGSSTPEVHPGRFTRMHESFQNRTMKIHCFAAFPSDFRQESLRMSTAVRPLCEILDTQWLHTFASSGICFVCNLQKTKE